MTLSLTSEDAVPIVHQAVKDGKAVRVDGEYVDGVELRKGWITFTPVAPKTPPTPHFPYDIVLVEVGP